MMVPVEAKPKVRERCYFNVRSKADISQLNLFICVQQGTTTENEHKNSGICTILWNTATVFSELFKHIFT